MLGSARGAVRGERYCRGPSRGRGGKSKPRNSKSNINSYENKKEVKFINMDIDHPKQLSIQI